MPDILSTIVDDLELTLNICHQKTAASGYPVFSLDIYLNGQRDYQFINNNPISTRLQLKLLGAGLNLLDSWCQANPNTYLSTFGDVGYFYRWLIPWGAACDGRTDTWFTFINSQGERRLYPGVLNAIEDCLDVDDLWRVAKDTNYYLGNLITPIDLINQGLAQAGIRNLIESGYDLEQDFTHQFNAYRERFQHYQTTLLTFGETEITGQTPLHLIWFQPQDEPEENADVRFYADVRLLAALHPQYLTLFPGVVSSSLWRATQAQIEAAIAAFIPQLLALEPEKAIPFEL
jgi:hypothetical protein